MARGRLHVKGWRAQIRVASRTREIPASSITAGRIDQVLRRCSSIARFALRLDAMPCRKELVIKIVALRHTSTSRADAAVMPLLRRLFPEIEKGAWAQIPADNRGMGNEVVFADYQLIEDDSAMKELAELPQNVHANSCISTTDTPVIQVPKFVANPRSQ